MTNALLKQDLRTLINSHLFCVDNLSGAEIRERLNRDGPPVGYDGQHLLGYHWFAYPNAADGLYSKVLARANMFGDLVVGNDEETCLVCIKHGRFSVTRQVGNDVVSVHDKRLLMSYRRVAMRNAMFFPNRILYREELLSTTVTYAVDLDEAGFLSLKPVIPIEQLGIRPAEFRLNGVAEKILERYAIHKLHYLASVNADLERVQHLVENWDYREVGHITIGSFRPGPDGGYAIWSILQNISG